MVLICCGSRADGQKRYDTRLFRACGAREDKQDADRCAHFLVSICITMARRSLDGCQSQRPSLAAAAAIMLPYVSGSSLRFCRVEQRCNRTPVMTFAARTPIVLSVKRHRCPTALEKFPASGRRALSTRTAGACSGRFTHDLTSVSCSVPTAK